MKKVSAITIMLVLSLFIFGCGGPQKVTDKQMTLSLSYGDRSGTYTGEVNEQGVPNGKEKFTTQNAQEILGFTKVISKTVISKGRGAPYGQMTMKNNPATIQMIV